MGEGGRVLAELRETADLVLAAAPEIGAEQELLAEFRTQINRLELAFAIATRPLVQGWKDDDYPADLTPTQYLRYECKMASGPAAALVEVGEMLEVLPKSRAALEAGRIGLAHLNLIAYTAEWVGEGFSEDRLLKKAEKLNVTSFARACTRFRCQADPGRFAQEEREVREARFLELTSNSEDGSAWLRGFFDAEGAAHLRAAIEALARTLPDDRRTPKQRRADALVEIARVALDEGKIPVVNGVRPHLQITATLETLLGLPGAAPAELEGAGPISMEMLRRLAGDCSIRRLLLDEDSMVIDVGRERRLIRGATRIAAEHRDGGCIWRGCPRPPRHCQGHHPEPWWLGGKTTLENTSLLCLFHHHLLDEGWELIKTEEGWIPRPPIWAIKAPEIADG